MAEGSYMKKKTLLKPRSVSEAKSYEKKVGKMLVDFIIEKLGNKKEYINLNKFNPEHLFKPEMAFVNKEDKFKLSEAKKGKSPLRLNLDPIIFDSNLIDSGVPYLKVSVTSWLNKENPKALLHQLLALVKK